MNQDTSQVVQQFPAQTATSPVGRILKSVAVAKSDQDVVLELIKILREQDSFNFKAIKKYEADRDR